MKLAALYILVTPILVLALAGITVLLPDVMANAPASGPHQFSEVLYAFTSGANNNGSAFGGITSSGPYLSIMLGHRHAAGPVPADRPGAGPGRLPRPAGKIPASAGTVPTHGPLFGSLLLGVTVILTALSYFPGPRPGPPRRRTPQMTRVPDGTPPPPPKPYADGNPLGTPGEHKHHTKAPAKLTASTVAAALPVAVRKLAPRPDDPFPGHVHRARRGRPVHG